MLRRPLLQAVNRRKLRYVLVLGSVRDMYKRADAVWLDLQGRRGRRLHFGRPVLFWMLGRVLLRKRHRPVQLLLGNHRRVQRMLCRLLVERGCVRADGKRRRRGLGVHV